MYVSGHPFEPFARYFRDANFNCGLLADYEEDEETGERTYAQIESGQQVVFGGLIAGVKKINTRAGATMAFVTVEDLYGNIDCVAFPRIYDRARHFLKADAVVKVTGKIDISPDKLPVIIADKIEEFVPPEEKREAPARNERKSGEQVLWLDARNMGEEDFEELLDTLSGYAGETPCKVLHGGKRYEFPVRLTRALMAELRTFLPESAIKLV